jgi:hypothetical protein
MKREENEDTKKDSDKITMIATSILEEFQQLFTQYN